jgi:hypothetical protein
MVQKPEYRNLTRAAARRIANHFAISDQADVIFMDVTRAAQAFDQFRSLPDYSYTRETLQDLSKKLEDLRILIDSRARVLKPRLHGYLLRKLGEDLTYGALQRLVGEKHVLMPFGLVEIEEYDERTKLDRSGIAARAGPQLLVSFIGEMRERVEASLAAMPSKTPGRPIKHLFRRHLISQLAELYVWLFDEVPTSTMWSKRSKRRLFSEFCMGILVEMQIDVTGLRDDIDAGLREAGYLGPRSSRRRVR